MFSSDLLRDPWKSAKHQDHLLFARDSSDALFQSQWGDEKCRTRAIPEGEIKEMGVSVCLTFFFLVRGDAPCEIYSYRSGSNSAISHNN
jgi:hypothetical protein